MPAAVASGKVPACSQPRSFGFSGVSTSDSRWPTSGEVVLLVADLAVIAILSSAWAEGYLRNRNLRLRRFNGS